LQDGDTLFSDKLTRYLNIVKSIGFEVIYEENFQPPRYEEDEPSRNETYFVMARRDGLLLSFDTYNGDSINGGSLYYNWKLNEGEEYPYRYTRSGGWEFPEGVDRYKAPMSEATWVGNHDCREALVFNISRLEEHGNFVTPWVKQPFMWLSHYGDICRQDFQSDALTKLMEDRIAQFPDWVKEMIIPNYEPTTEFKI
jgi:hypothetical protein